MGAGTSCCKKEETLPAGGLVHEAGCQRIQAQRAHYGLMKEYTLNDTWTPYRLSCISQSSAGRAFGQGLGFKDFGDLTTMYPPPSTPTR